MARELIILPRFKRDYRLARKLPEFDIETLEYVLDVMIAGGKLPDALREHRLDKRSVKGCRDQNNVGDVPRVAPSTDPNVHCGSRKSPAPILPPSPL